MKIQVNGKDLFEVSDIQKKVLAYEISTDKLEDDLKRRLHWVLMHKYEQCFKRLKKEWDSKLAANGVKLVPTDPDEYAALVVSQPNYQDASARNALLHIDSDADRKIL